MFKIKVEIFDLDGNLKAKKKFSNIPAHLAEEEDSDAEVNSHDSGQEWEPEYPENELDNDEEMEWTLL